MSNSNVISTLLSSLLCVCEVYFSSVGLFLTKKDDIRDCWSDLGVSAGILWIVDFRILCLFVSTLIMLIIPSLLDSSKNSCCNIHFKGFKWYRGVSIFLSKTFIFSLVICVSFWQIFPNMSYDTFGPPSILDNLWTFFINDFVFLFFIFLVFSFFLLFLRFSSAFITTAG